MAYLSTIRRFMESDQPGLELPTSMATETKDKYRRMFPNLKIIVSRGKTYLINESVLSKERG
jgi:hypothetical protein